MNAATLYQDFSSEEAGEPRTAGALAADVEDEKLQSFEDGYQAGWDDATKAHHEARGQLTKTVHEIMRGVVGAILPEIARQSLGAHIAQLVDAHTREAVAHKIQLRVAEVSREQVERLLPDTPVDYEVISDPCLAPDQATLQLDETEHAVDRGQVVKDVHAAVTEYFETQISEGKDD